MVRDKQIDFSYLRKILDYDPDSGIFHWKTRGNKRIDTRLAGKVAGVTGRDGYKVIRIDGIGYYAHRLAWWHFFQQEIVGEIDHINGQRDDNRISNLRIVSRLHNAQMRHRVHSSSGYMGVTWHKRDKKYQASIKSKGKNIHLGYFKSAEEASNAYQVAKQKIDEEFMNQYKQRGAF
ncbi:HNH endonuclease [Glaesserella parasuis]|nr:HNH endonuclease [Glaesserella parasuis]MCT8746644.1 HNH endonuclease [Glaesserella parasuis]MCT8747626.1 HNH endonuclease [Glaesserella parasuis]MCT8771037.1 HNH endonuclease [Glaesserella parasuis]MCT8777581.1 HNH endonuclease [Glaesserella parasuis]